MEIESRWMFVVFELQHSPVICDGKLNASFLTVVALASHGQCAPVDERAVYVFVCPFRLFVIVKVRSSDAAILIQFVGPR